MIGQFILTHNWAVDSDTQSENYVSCSTPWEVRCGFSAKNFYQV